MQQFIIPAAAEGGSERLDASSEVVSFDPDKAARRHDRGDLLLILQFATADRQLTAALLLGVGNFVFHPADYAILSGSIDPARLGRSFAFHTFTGNIGFAAAPPATATRSGVAWVGGVP